MNHSGWTPFWCTTFLKKFNKSMLQSKSMDSNFSKCIKTSQGIFLCHSLGNPSTAAWMRYQGTVLWQSVVVTYSTPTTSTSAFWLNAAMWFWGKSSAFTIGCSSLQSSFVLMSWIPAREKSTRSSDTDACPLCSNLWWVHKGPGQKLVLWTTANSTRRDVQWLEVFHSRPNFISTYTGYLGVRSVCCLQEMFLPHQISS